MKDVFKISNGNLKVLETIPLLMKDKESRKKLRSLVIEYLYQKK